MEQTSGCPTLGNLPADPNLSERAAALVKEQPGGAGEEGVAVVAQIQEPQPPLLDLSDIDVGDILFEDYIVEDAASSTQEPGAGVATTSVEPDVRQMLGMPSDSRRKWVQFNQEAGQVRNQNLKYRGKTIFPHLSSVQY